MAAITRKSPFWLPDSQVHSARLLINDHTSALYALGEYVFFALMWHVSDFEAELVGRCTTCYVPRLRISEAYKQSDNGKCPDCFGTSFDGGYRALIVRPALISDKNTDTVLARRGEVTTDSVSLETTTDFSTHSGDYVIRADGTRYRMEEMGTLVVRSGFDLPIQSQSVGGLIPGAKLEDLSSVAYLIPPETEEANAILLGLAVNRHTPQDVTVLDDLRGPLITGVSAKVIAPYSVVTSPSGP